MPGPTFIECDRIELKTIEEEDLPFLREGVNHPDVRRYIDVFRTPHTEERYREELWPIETGDDGVSLLAVPREGERAGDPVGSVQLYPIDHARGWANIGVWFHPKVWGKGYALDACAHLLDYGFRRLRLHRISASAMAPNEASVALCERLGFVHEGTVRETSFVDGERVDDESYGLLVHEWEGPEAVLGG
ncbi:GNAT family N-acetyltransferase [Halomarina pelagica]|uniref:GNAT family N-acetyltransferase n=1 Tax=Halomarina pelagica TaxID=2961599 RepID=UPI0020C1D9DA|nr:GNAT family protein [Halomarina sp. BND7]